MRMTLGMAQSDHCSLTSRRRECTFEEDPNFAGGADAFVGATNGIGLLHLEGEDAAAFHIALA